MELEVSVETASGMKAIDVDPPLPSPGYHTEGGRVCGREEKGGAAGPPPLLHVPSQRLMQTPASHYDNDHMRRHPTPTALTTDKTITVSGEAGVSAPLAKLSGGRPRHRAGDRTRTPGDGSSGGLSNRADMLLRTYARSSPHDCDDTTHRTLHPHPEDSGCGQYGYRWQHSPFLGQCVSGGYMGLPGKERLSHTPLASVYGHRRFSESSLSYLSGEGAGYLAPHHPRHHPHTPAHRWSPKGRTQKNGMMEDSGHQEGAINLSTVREGSQEEEHVNGDITHNGHNGHDPGLPQPPPRIPGKGTPVPALSGAAKRKNKAPVDAAAAAVAAAMQGAQQQQNLLMLAAQQGLTPQQMQALQQQLVGSSQQSIMQQQQQQQSLLLQHQQKVNEQALHQLNEQLQVNILRQSELLQQAASGLGEKGKGGTKVMQQQLQQLAVQQQQLVQQIQQIQLQQRQYLLACLVQPFALPQGMMSPAEMQALWKEVSVQSGLEETALKALNGLSLPSPPSSTANGQIPHLHSPPNFMTNGSLPIDPFALTDAVGDAGKLSSFAGRDGAASPVSTALFRHHLCKWPGCDTPCEDCAAFIKHLSVEHQLDDRSTAQARVQLQVVSQLEIQLSREKELLQAMMQHLHMKAPSKSSASSSSLSSTSTSSAAMSSSTSSKSTSVPLPLPPPPQPAMVKAPMESKQEPTTPILPKHPMIPPPFTASPFLPTVSMVTSPMVPLPHTPTTVPHLMLSQPPPSIPTLLSHSADRCGGGSAPGPIRRRVSDKCNLPISTEIQRNREFYKTTDVRPPFTYASLIRQAIIESPHRQLTLNEIYQWFQATFAYFRRNEATWKNAVRHNLSLHKCFMRVENVKGAVWTVDEIEFYKRRPQKLSGGIKSPSLNDPSSYSETINATIRAALGEAGLAMMGHGVGMMDQDMAQDLSLKSVSTSNSQDGLMAMARSLGDEEILLSIKREAGLDPDTPTFLDGPSPGARIMVPLPPKRSSSTDDDQPPPLLTSTSRGFMPPHGKESMEGEVGRLGQEGASGDEDLPPEGGEEEDYVRMSPRMADHYGDTGDSQADYPDGEESTDHDMAQHRGYMEEGDMMGEDSVDHDMAHHQGYVEEEDMTGGEDEREAQEEDGVSQGEEESVEASLREEGPQPGLEAEDDLVDNLPVFPVPQLQPVTSS